MALFTPPPPSKPGTYHTPTAPVPRTAPSGFLRRKKRPLAPGDVASLRRILRRRHVSTGQLFAFMDGDRSDTITLREFEHGIAMSGVRPMPTASQIQGMFESFDANGDGSLSWAEVLRAVEDSGSDREEEEEEE